MGLSASIDSARPRRKVAIIGAGASGLAALHQAIEHGLDPTVFETRDRTGGAWILTDPGECVVEFDNLKVARLRNPDENDHAHVAPTPMYPSLKTNVPTPLMEYRGQPFDRQIGLFPSPKSVLEYLDQTAAGVEQRIRLRTRVTRLRHTLPRDKGEQRRWTVETATVSRQTNFATNQFDYVVIANGHYSQPFVPRIEGLDTWTRQLTHARWYRNPEQFRGKTVLVVGSGPSGYDATRELAEQIYEQRQRDSSVVLPRLYQSLRSPSKMGIAFDDPSAPAWAQQVIVKPTITKVDETCVTFADGTIADDIDVIDAPWNSAPLVHPPSPTKPITGLRVHNLDKRDLFYAPDPTCAFMCIQYLVLPFPLAQIQARTASKFWSGKVNLLVEAKESTDEEQESRESLVYGHPMQYDKHDEWLQEIGEGKFGQSDEMWKETPQTIRDLRLGAKSLRRSVLGY
ncbi:monooxygenase [Microbotryomycetes sp. JL201]|nr:monooxygenase [Microbotryomycetes sp. JL201]